MRLLLLICVLMPLGEQGLRAQVPQDPALVASRLLVRGMTRSFLGDLEGAAQLFDQALRLQPEDAAIHGALAGTYVELGDLAQATFYAERALQLAPDRAENITLVAELRETTGDGVGALEAYDQLVALKPQRAEAHLARARLLSRLEQRVAAADAYATALSLAPGNPEILREYRNVTLSLGDLETALNTATSLVELDPSAADEQVRAEILVRLDRTDEAIAAFQRVLALSPGDREATAALESLAPGLSTTGDTSGDPVAYAARLAEAADDDVRNLALRIDAIRANLEVGQSDVARLLVEDGMLFFPGDPELTLAAFDTFVHALRLDEAAETLDQAEALSDQNDWREQLAGARLLIQWLHTGEPSDFDTAPLLGAGSTRTALQWLVQGDIHARAGNRSRAVAAWEAALAAAPDSDLVLARLQ